MNPIVHFEIHAKNVERAKKFYEKSFGWKIKKFSMPTMDYYIIHSGPTDKDNMLKEQGMINGGMMKAKKGSVMMNYIAVPSIDKKLVQVKKYGGKVLMKKTEIAPGMGFIACIKDTEGNMMGLHEMVKGGSKKPSTKKATKNTARKKTAKRKISKKK